MPTNELTLPCLVLLCHVVDLKDKPLALALAGAFDHSSSSTFGGKGLASEIRKDSPRGSKEVIARVIEPEERTKRKSPMTMCLPMTKHCGHITIFVTNLSTTATPMFPWSIVCAIC